MRNPTLLQCFHWYYPEGGKLWPELAERADGFNDIGINMVWLPPAYINLLLQNNIAIKSCDIILSRVENNGIIIASISIYIDKEFVRYTNLVSSIVYDNFGITPNIMTE